MEQALKMMTMAAGLCITCVLIGFGFMVLREGKQLAAVFLEEVKEEERLSGEYKFTRFQDAEVSGAEVIHAITKYRDVLFFSVSDSQRVQRFGKRDIVSGRDFEKGRLSEIDAFETFEGKVLRNENGEIYGIAFRKREEGGG